MTRFPRLWAFLTGCQLPPSPRAQALADYTAAMVRCDTRGQHAAWLRLRDATHQALASSCGEQLRRRGVSSR